MAELLKNMYNPFFFERLCPVLKKELPQFEERDFIYRVFDTTWPDLELKQRVRHITHALHAFLPRNYKEAAPVLVRLTEALRASQVREQSFGVIFLADYIEVYGLEHFEESMQAMEEVTKLVSAEFAVRSFLLRYPEKTMYQLTKWSRHREANVRRLASEGCRPRLPWAIGIPYLKKDPSPILSILDNLKDDPSEYVRRSVANNLNDIAKDHPDIVMKIARSWQGRSSQTDWILKHGCRTLLKKGHSDALGLHGFNPESRSQVKNFSLSRRDIKTGEDLVFTLVFRNKEKTPTNFRLEYAIDYITSTGKTSTKIFKIQETIVDPDEEVNFKRKQSFKDLTTRKHYPGKHCITILVNGKKQAREEFMVF